MNKFFYPFAFICLFACVNASANTPGIYSIEPVPFTAVNLGDGFWGQRLSACRIVTVPLAFSKCEETGRYENFNRAAAPCDTFTVRGFSFDDTDVYKTIEGASYLLQTYPDASMEAYIDSVLLIVAAAQEPDGYLYTSRTMNPAHPHPWAGDERWSKVERLSHEFYNLGHMVDGAVAHYQATGKRSFLDIATAYADCVCREIGDGEGQVCRVPGHQIAEMALARLYVLTGDGKYLDQAKYFLDKRGHTTIKDTYSQSHMPVTEQSEAVGHAVRAAYMYAGMADVAALTGDSAYIDAIDRIWDNIVQKKLYITGGIGARHQGEAFGADYELPNLTAYCETCASIGNVYVNHRLFLLHGDSKYYDVLERTLYNGLISGMSVDGGSFFYPNPLESDGTHQRQPWFGCACCPSNLCRFIPSVPGYIYAAGDGELYVNLFMNNTAGIDIGDNRVRIAQETSYPFDGVINLRIDSCNVSTPFTLKLRLPGWASNQVVPSDLYTFADDKTTSYNIKLNGVGIAANVENGYLSINRAWRQGDTVQLNIDMPTRIVKANENVEADRGLLAVERGPLVYCAEWPDNEMDVEEIAISTDSEFTPRWRDDLPGGLVTLESGDITLIPYYAWAHRGPGKMRVWLNRKSE